MLTPRVGDAAAVARCLPLADGVLVVLDATLGLCSASQILRHLSQAALQPLREGLECVLMINKLDLLLGQEPSLPECFKAVRRLILAVGHVSGIRMDPTGSNHPPNVVFGRGSFDNGRRKQRENGGEHPGDRLLPCPKRQRVLVTLAG